MVQRQLTEPSLLLRKTEFFVHFDAAVPTEACIPLDCFMLTDYFQKSLTAILHVPKYKAELSHGHIIMTEFKILGIREHAHIRTRMCAL
jgi:hypothetical protein